MVAVFGTGISSWFRPGDPSHVTKHHGTPERKSPSEPADEPLTRGSGTILRYETFLWIATDRFWNHGVVKKYSSHWEHRDYRKCHS